MDTLRQTFQNVFYVCLRPTQQDIKRDKQWLGLPSSVRVF